MASFPASVTTEELSTALFRLHFAETDKFLNMAASQMIETDEDRHAIANRLASISRSSQHQLRDVILKLSATMKGLDRTVVNCLVFMNRSAEHWNKKSPLDPFVKQALLRRRFIFAALLLDQPEFVLDSSHPVNEIMGLVEQLFMGWEESKGQPPAFIMRSLAALTRLLDADHCLIREEQIAARDELFEAWSKEEARRKKLEERLVQSELGLDLAWYAEARAQATIQEFASQHSLPTVVNRFLLGPWKNTLRASLHKGEGEDKQFSRLVKITDRIVFTFRDGLSKAQVQRMLDYAPVIVDELEKTLALYGVSSDSQLDYFEELQQLVLQLIQGHGLERERFLAPGDWADDLPGGGKLEEQITPYLGQWFRRFDKVCRLLVYLPKQQSVLWSDFSGRKVDVESARHFLVDIQEGSAQSFNVKVRIQHVFQRMAKEFVKADQERQEVLRSRLEKERQVRLAAKAKAEAEARAIIAAREEREQQLEQERRATEERLKREALAEQERLALEKEQQARDQVNGLAIGDWVEIEKRGEMVKCKLGVRLNATGRMIFVDNFGMKMADIHRDEAVSYLKEEKLRVLGKDAELEDRLSRAVGRMGIAKR